MFPLFGINIENEYLGVCFRELFDFGLWAKTPGNHVQISWKGWLWPNESQSQGEVSTSVCHWVGGIHSSNNKKGV